MNIGYARTSTVDQSYGFEAQIDELRSAGCEKIFQEQVSSVGDRKALEEALEFAREGDSLVVTKLDRLARSVQHLILIVNQLQDKDVSLRILNLGIDTQTPTGKLMLTMLGSIGEFEREMMLERQREGIRRAKLEGKYKGRKPTVRAKRGEMVALLEQGVTKSEIARRLGVSRMSVHRVLKETV